MNNVKKSVSIAVGAMMASAAGVSAATASPFSYSELASGYQQQSHQQVPDKHKEGKCGGERKEEMKDKAKEGKCGEGKCGETHKAEMKGHAEEMKGKAEEMKGHAEEMKDKAEEGKCGEGKCGEGKCGAA
ncbi:hypothetical protein [Pseudidiomarina sp.]|uniref:HvfA family oxazolone/thioamide-modified RiPP metallophore n=1 Tax=Pseudidiomarina sp. TaxID=2081707 RepID=UPI00299DB167|nr:hypothetical protein [Pseudidiomarina sp.]MDX1705134.1 hypothetical protein [Pseudidiomarina sp.]